jgi:hypothetical protein
VATSFTVGEAMMKLMVTPGGIPAATKPMNRHRRARVERRHDNENGRCEVADTFASTAGERSGAFHGPELHGPPPPPPTTP